MCVLKSVLEPKRISNINGETDHVHRSERLSIASGFPSFTSRFKVINIQLPVSKLLMKIQRIFKKNK